jgi:hypothetical protein
MNPRPNVLAYQVNEDQQSSDLNYLLASNLMTLRRCHARIT